MDSAENRVISHFGGLGQFMYTEQPWNIQCSEGVEVWLAGVFRPALAAPDFVLAAMAPPPCYPDTSHAACRRLFGEVDGQQAAPQQALSSAETAGLAAVVEALQQTTAELEERGVLQVAAAGDSWWLPEGPGGSCRHDGGSGGSSLVRPLLHEGATAPSLPDYLQPGQGGQPGDGFGMQQAAAAQEMSADRYQHWPAPGVAASESDAIQEADGECG